MNNVGMQLPRYTCHKQVNALKIADIRPISNNGWALEFDDARFAAHVVEDAWIRRHLPQAGGYLIVYDDGYRSFSPAKAFEEGYTLDTDSKGTKCAKCGYVRTVWAVCPSGCDTSMGQFLNDVNEGLRRLRESGVSDDTMTVEVDVSPYIRPNLMQAAQRNFDAQGRVLSGCAVRAAIQDDEADRMIRTAIGDAAVAMIQDEETGQPTQEQVEKNAIARLHELAESIDYAKAEALMEARNELSDFVHAWGGGGLDAMSAACNREAGRILDLFDAVLDPPKAAPLEEGETVKGEALFKTDNTEPGTMEFLGGQDGVQPADTAMASAFVSIEIECHGHFVARPFEAIIAGDRFRVSAPPERVDGVICTARCAAYPCGQLGSGNWGVVVMKMERPEQPPDLAVEISTDANVLTKMRESVAAIEDQPPDIIIDTSNDPVPRDGDREVRVGRWLEVLGTSLRSRRSPVHCRVETDTTGPVPVTIMTVTLRPEARTGAWGNENPIPYHLFGLQA